jgi:hypothetical protein
MIEREHRYALIYRVNIIIAFANLFGKFCHFLKALIAE